MTDVEKSFYETICDTSPVGLFHINENGDMTYVNKKYEQIVGRSFEEIKNEGWKEIIHLQDMVKVLSEWEKSIRDKKDFCMEFRIVRKGDHKTVWVLAQSSFKQNGCVGTLTNINKRKQLIESFNNLKNGI